MRAKYVLERLQLNHKIKIVYDRITLTKFTLAFVIVAIVGCFAQIGVQSAALANNSRALNVVDNIIQSVGGHVEFAFIRNGVLFTCSKIPKSGNPYDASCWALAGPGVSLRNTTDSMDQRVSVGEVAFTRRHDYGNTTKAKQDGRKADSKKGDSLDINGPNVTLTATNDMEVSVSPRCIQALDWPAVVLHDAKREDVCFLIFQMWLLGISFLTVLGFERIRSAYDRAAAVVTHGLATAWSAFQISRIGNYMSDFQQLVVNDACDGANVLPDFWQSRMAVFIPILVINAVTWLATMGIALRLLKVYASQTLRRVRASRQLNVRYLSVLLFSVSLQLSAFFTIIGSALWIDAICNTTFDNSRAYLIVFVIVCVLELPWVVLGWNAIRKENRLWSLVFIITGCGLVGAFCAMFASTLYSFTFRSFPFFATVTVTAFIVLVASVALACICRFGFGQGLPQYLKTEEKFDDSSLIPVIIPKPSFRQSRLISVIFPDKRVSALQKKQGGNLGPRSSSVMDIKGPGEPRTSFDAVSNVSSIAPSQAKRTRSTKASESLLERARTPFSHWSNGSRLGMLSKHLSSYTSSTLTSDLERGAPPPVDMPAPPVPALPKFVPGPVSPPKAYAPENRLSDEPPPPAINMIPASVSRTMSLDQRYLHSRPPSEMNLGSSSYRPSVLVAQGPERSSPPKGRVGLPGNPRAFRPR